MAVFFSFLQSLFLQVFNMSLSAVWIILAVILLRFLFKKAPKSLVCALWVLVAVRLVFPSVPKSSLSLLPSKEVLSSSASAGGASPTLSFNTGLSSLNNFATSALQPLENANRFDVTAVLSVVWAVGVVAMLLYMAVSYLLLRKKVAPSIEQQKGVRLCDNIDSPFILGVVKPVIYIPSSLSGGELEAVLSHERAHLRRKDHIVKPLAFLVLSVYWFNPLCVLSYILLCRDIEFACDERVIKTLDGEKRCEYSQTLLDLGKKAKQISACPLAFGEVGVKERIKNILNYKKPAFWLVVVALVSCVAVSVLFVMDPKEEQQPLSNDFLSVVKEYSDVKGVSLGFSSVRYDEEEDKILVKLRWNNETDEALHYGRMFTISKYNEKTGEWEYPDVEGRVYTLEAFIVRSKESRESNIEYTLFREINNTPGRYRFGIAFSFESEPTKDYHAYVVFDLERALGESFLTYRYEEEDSFCEIKLNSENNTAEITMPTLSSLCVYGEVESDETRLVIKCVDFEYTYVFEKGENCLIYNAKESREIGMTTSNGMEFAKTYVPDGAVFALKKIDG